MVPPAAASILADASSVCRSVPTAQVVTSGRATFRKYGNSPAKGKARRVRGPRACRFQADQINI
jgi:hypothetical protein